MSSPDAARPEVEAEVRALGAAGHWDAAAAALLRAFGDELADYLAAIARSETDGADAFAQFTVDAWRGLPGFRWEAGLRTWCYRVARHALARVRREPHRRRHEALGSRELVDLAEQIRTRTAAHLRTAVKDQVRELRLQLAPEDQAILIMRVDRDLSWRDIAMIMTDDDAPLTEPEVVRRAAGLRKRFERIKAELRALARAAGLGSRD
ncbi:MAG: sigma-70 family RNA polymerase sigma factor [Myxococcales bacterium]|nr:sigma-70 family RNA polymerase sigma factor [Myxococcales bacterium]